MTVLVRLSFFLFPDHSYPTIILSLSCFSCPACSVCCPILLLPFLAILFCPESFILSFLSLLSCSRIFCMDYHLLQAFMKQLFRPVYPVLLYIPFCPLMSCSDLIILYSIAISISNSCPSVSAKVLLSCSVISHHYSILLLGILLKGSSYFNPCPVHCCPSCRLSCLSPQSILSKDLYPNTQCNIQSQLSFSSFCEPIIISLTVFAKHPVHRCCPVILSCPSYPVLSLHTYFCIFSWLQ